MEGMLGSGMETSFPALIGVVAGNLFGLIKAQLFVMPNITLERALLGIVLAQLFLRFDICLRDLSLIRQVMPCLLMKIKIFS